MYRLYIASGPCFIRYTDFEDLMKFVEMLFVDGLFSLFVLWRKY
jgi:hypothetical protein